jgi:DNA-binding beta-propeller fold protein YncE
MDLLLAVGHSNAPNLTLLDGEDAWSAASGMPTGLGSVEGAAFSPDRAFLAIAHATSPYLTVLDTSDWSVVSGTPVLDEDEYGYAVAFSPDGAYLAVAVSSEQSLYVLDTSDWSVVSGTPSLDWDEASSVAFSPDGAYLAVGRYFSNSHQLMVLDTSDWSQVSAAPTLSGWDLGVAFSPDGAYLAVARDSSPRLTVLDTSDWSVVSGTPTLAGTGWGVAFSPDGAYLAIAHNSSPRLTVLDTSDWSVVSGTPVLSGNNGYGVSFSADGAYLAIAHSGAPCLTVLDTSDWSSASGIPTVSGQGLSVAFIGPASALPPREIIDGGERFIFRAYLTLPGEPNLELPISSFQARNRLTTRNYLAVVVPDPLPYIDAIAERRDGRLVVKNGFAKADGTEVLAEIASGVFSDFRYDLGPFNGSATLVGYDYRNPLAPITRKMRGISFRGMNNSGARRFRCEPDMYLQPGDTADLGDDETMIVDQVAFTVNANQATMEISEAESDEEDG